MNDLKVLACNIQYSYLTAKFWGNIFTVAGAEIVYEKVKVMRVVRALYGLKLPGKALRDLLYEQLHGLGYGP